MKKIILSLLTISAIFLTGCFETTQEITLHEDGSGIISNTNDMSALLALAAQMGAGKELEKAGEIKIDSSFSLEKGADSIADLSPGEKEMMKKGMMKINADIKAGVFITKTTIPFSSPSDIATCNKLSGKIMAEVMKDQAGEHAAAGGGIPEISSLDDYYIYSFSGGELTKTLNKEKYAGAANDEFLKGMQQAGGMGLVMKSNYVINLPRPAKELVGKGAKLSGDKMKVTITATVDDFLSDPSLLEFTIKY